MTRLNNHFYKCFIILLITLGSKSLHAQWNWVNPLPSGLAGKDIVFTNDQNGFIITNTELWSTNNQGAVWTLHSKYASLNDFAFLGNIGFMVGNYGLIYKSSDGGASWEPIDSKTFDHFNSVSITGEQTIYITSDVHLFKSIDGGRNWTQSDINVPVNPNNRHFLIDKSVFRSSTVGYLGCHFGQILKTIDGGDTWYITEDTGFDPSDYHAIFFVNDDVGYASRGWSDVMKTSNGGETWQELPSHYWSTKIYGLYFLTADTGYMAGGYGSIYKTTNGGVDWEPIWFQQNLIEQTDMYALYFFDEDKGFVTGMRGRVIKTENAGEEWSQYSFTYSNIGGISFPSDNIGYVFSDGVYKTIDQGKTWTKLSCPLDITSGVRGYSAGYFISEQRGIACSYNTSCALTNDGGETWTLLPVGGWDISFVNDKVGYVGRSSGLSKTEDGGETWTDPSYFGAIDVNFVTESTGYCLSFGDLFKTSDGGVTWTKIYDLYEDILDITFPSEKTGYLVSNFSLMKTTNGGATWTSVKNDNQYYMTGIEFISENVGLVSHQETNSIWMTTNGGASWEAQYSPVTAKKFAFTSNGKAFAGGDNGALIQSVLDFPKSILNAYPAESITKSSATLKGMVVSNFDPIKNIKLEYGIQSFDKYATLNQIEVPSGESAAYSIIVNDLLPDSKYQFRITGTYNGVNQSSNTLEFKTLPEVNVPEIDPTTGINAQKSELRIFPNPTGSELNIMSGNSIDKVTVIDLFGREIFSIQPKTDQLQVNMVHYNPGIYIIKVMVNGQQLESKILKK